MAYYETDVNILRDGKIQNKSSREIVPGDIVFLREAIKIPFDGILIQGSILVN